MTDNHVWVSAQLLHPFQPNVFVQMSWKEERQPGGRLELPLFLGCVQMRFPRCDHDRGAYRDCCCGACGPREASAGISPKCGSQGWGSSSDDDDNYQAACSSGRRLLTPGISCSSQPLPPPDDWVPTPPGTLPPGFQLSPVSDANSTLTGFRAVDCPLRLRVDDVFVCYCEDDRDWMDAWRTQQSFSASRHATLFSDLYADREPAPDFLDQSLRRAGGLALRSDQRNLRQTDKLPIISWNPGLARGSDSSLLASYINVPWRVISVQERSGFVTDSSLAENFHVITQHHSAVLLCARLLVDADPVFKTLTYSSWAVEGMVVTGKFRRALDPSCAYLTVASVHINDEYAKRRFLFISLFLLIRDLCIKLGAVIFTSDFNKGAERELASSAPVDQRRISPLKAAFSHANVPWRTSGVTPLWVPDGESQGSQNHWMIMRHRSINVVPASIGLKTTD